MKWHTGHCSASSLSPWGVMGVDQKVKTESSEPCQQDNRNQFKNLIIPEIDHDFPSDEGQRISFSKSVINKKRRFDCKSALFFNFQADPASPDESLFKRSPKDHPRATSRSIMSANPTTKPNVAISP